MDGMGSVSHCCKPSGARIVLSRIGPYWRLWLCTTAKPRVLYNSILIGLELYSLAGPEAETFSTCFAANTRQIRCGAVYLSMSFLRSHPIFTKPVPSMSSDSPNVFSMPNLPCCFRLVELSRHHAFSNASLRALACCPLTSVSRGSIMSEAHHNEPETWFRNARVKAYPYT